jgi:hypothetical protein
MQQFPALKDNEVTLIKAELTTGHILDEYYKLAVRDDQAVYTIFENLEKAIIAAQKIIRENSNIECVIYGQGNVQIKYITTEK